MDDFWWLPENVALGGLLVGVGHHKGVADSEDMPPLDSWYRSLDLEGNLSNNIRYYPINSLSKWRGACKNTNVYRTLKLFDQNTRKAVFIGPFLIDIDNSSENLDDAQAVTKQIVAYLIKQLKLSSGDMRIFFSGHKGFNVEVRSETLGINGPIPKQIRLSSGKLNDIITILRNNNNIQDFVNNVISSQGTVIDRIYGDRFGYRLKHPYIRLHDSINKWIRNNGSEMAQMKTALTTEQLCNIEAAELARMAQLI